MEKEVIMPQMGVIMTEGKVFRWRKHPGDPVTKGEPILEVETEKVTSEVEAEVSGILDRILVQEGETVPVGQAIAVIRLL